MVFSPATKEAANDTVSDAKNTAYNAKRDLRKSGEGALSEVTNDITEYANKAGREVRHLIDSTSEQITQYGDKVTFEIRNHPVRSSAIALGIGVVLGALIRR